MSNTSFQERDILRHNHIDLKCWQRRYCIFPVILFYIPPGKRQGVCSSFAVGLTQLLDLIKNIPVWMASCVQRQTGKCNNGDSVIQWPVTMFLQKLPLSDEVKWGHPYVKPGQPCAKCTIHFFFFSPPYGSFVLFRLISRECWKLCVLFPRHEQWLKYLQWIK